MDVPAQTAAEVLLDRVAVGSGLTVTFVAVVVLGAVIGTPFDKNWAA